MTGHCFQPLEGLLLPSLMMTSGLGSLHDRGWSRPSFLEAGARERLQRGDLQRPPLLTSRSWGFSSPSFSFPAQQLKAAGGSVPGPSFCSRHEGGAAKPCVRLRSWLAKKPVLRLGKMCPSSGPPGAAVQAVAAGDRARRARAGGACSWMERKEVFICCCLGRSAISSKGVGLVFARVAFQTSVPRDASASSCGQT